MAHVIWNNPQSGERVQFIADIIKESLFDYAFDSNKIPSLNLHYFCKDYMTTYELVKEGVMKSGNLIPLNEEFESIIENAPWIPCDLTSSVFYFKEKGGLFRDVRKDKNIDELKRGEYYNGCVEYIDAFLGAKNSYYNQLLGEIEAILNGATYSRTEQQRLYYCVREAICELVNRGVSKAHIFNLAHRHLFSSITPEDDIQHIMGFLHDLKPKKNKYNVIFGVTEATYNELHDNIPSMRSATENEITRLEAEYVVSTEIEENDPVSALESAKFSFLVVLNTYNSFVHNENISVINSGLVKKDDEDDYVRINSPASIMKRNKIKPKEERIGLLKKAIVATSVDSVLSAFELHNIAVTSENTETQLLMLWTVFELLVETNQDTMNRINYIANCVVSVLNTRYYFHIIETLYEQISRTRETGRIIQKEKRGNTGIEKFALILKDNSTLQAELKSVLKAYPLEAYKIDYYSYILSSPERIKSDIARHSKRIRWQMMRIYRNRCMIVHDGSHLPYINNIIENLHFYVDELFEYMITCFGNGVFNPNAIFSDARIKEKHILDSLDSKTGSLSEEVYLDILSIS